MKVEETALPGVLLLSPTIYRDSRGAFFETWNQRAMALIPVTPQTVARYPGASVSEILRPGNRAGLKRSFELVHV